MYSIAIHIVDFACAHLLKTNVLNDFYVKLHFNLRTTCIFFDIAFVFVFPIIASAFNIIVKTKLKFENIKRNITMLSIKIDIVVDSDK